jgi:hypothetical protein
MPDPFTLSLLGAAATQGITFLYAQATEVLKARRARTATDTGPLVVPVVETDVLDRQPTATAVEPAVVEEHRASLAKLTGALSPYAQGDLDVDPDDAELAGQAAELRALLEAAYGVRFTFRGEQRPESGSAVTVKQAFADVDGTVVGAAGDVGAGGKLDVVQDVSGTVGTNAEVTGFRGNVGR